MEQQSGKMRIPFSRQTTREGIGAGEFKIAVTTPGGLEPVLASEMEALGLKAIEQGRRIVHAQSDLNGVYRALFELRTAIRVLVPLYTFRLNKSEDIYEGFRDFEWEDWMRVDQSLSIDGIIHSDLYRNSLFAVQRAKDGIVDRFKLRNAGNRPSVEVRNPDFKIHLLIQDKDVQVSFDVAGHSLHRRGYRVAQGAAPISEVLAAGMLGLANWQGDRPFIDLFCGSGTLLVEAAMVSGNIPAGKWAEAPGITRWNGHNQELWDSVRSDALGRQKPIHFPIQGWDNDLLSVKTAKTIIAHTGLEEAIKIHSQDMRRAMPGEDVGLICSNLPYGERIQLRDDKFVFRDLGKKLKFDFGGWQAWLLFGGRDAEADIGLKPRQRIPLMNGKLPVMFAGYSLFRGSRKEYLEGLANS
jgi:putative N6-adenine-specific DNA methylase